MNFENLIFHLFNNTYIFLEQLFLGGKMHFSTHKNQYSE